MWLKKTGKTEAISGGGGNRRGMKSERSEKEDIFSVNDILYLGADRVTTLKDNIFSLQG